MTRTFKIFKKDSTVSAALFKVQRKDALLFSFSQLIFLFPVTEVTRGRNPSATGKPGERVRSDPILIYPINFLYRMGWKYRAKFDFVVERLTESGIKQKNYQSGRPIHYILL